MSGRRVVIPASVVDSLRGAPGGGIGTWQPSTFYEHNKLVVNGNITYVCLVAHTSGDTFPGVGVDWQVWPLTFRALADADNNAPSDGQIATFVSSTGLITMKPPASLAATGPGGIAGANSDTTLSLPDPTSSNGYGLYHLTLAPSSGNAVTVTLPTPAGVGTRFVMRATQDVTGSRTLAFAATPPVVFPGVSLHLNSQAFAENWIAFEYAIDNNGNRTWYAFPATSSVTNLSDIADPDAARQNLLVQILRSTIRMFTSSGTALTGLQTIDGHTFVDGERVLRNVAPPDANNGPWVTHSGAWTRPTDFPTGASFRSRLVGVNGGTYANTLWTFNSDSQIVVDTTSTTWVQVGGNTVTPTVANYLAQFGDSTDSAAVLDGAATVAWATLSGGNLYTMSRDAYVTNLTVNNGIQLKLNGYRLFGSGTLTNNTGGVVGGIGNAASGATAGAKLTGGTLNSGQVGAAGGNGVGLQGTAGMVGTSGAGGASGGTAGGAARAGTLANVAAVKGVMATPAVAMLGLWQNGSATQLFVSGGSGGSAGAGDGSNAGGGGGSGGPLEVICFETIVNNGTIEAVGGNGGNGVGGNAGGGGGGSGGLIVIYTLSAVTGSGSIVVSGGTAGTQSGTGIAGNNGGSGISLTVVLK